MRIVRGLESFPPDAAPSAIALGVFDGVHLGHRAILGTAVTRARAAGIDALACTFDRHPGDVLQPGRAPAIITTLDDRLALIAETGVDGVVVLEFTRELAAIEPEAFVKDILLGRLRARDIVVGFNHRFGRGARGDARLLESLAARLGFQAHEVPPLLVDGVPVSSSEIRTALQRGDAAAAARFLGRPYAIAGSVTVGAGRGRSLGFPTANIEPDRPLLVARGVYRGRLEADARRHPCVVNVGVRPTFGERTLAVEAHLLDFTGDLYGRPVRLDFLDRLRDEMRFGSVDELRAQIARDIAAARAAGG
ncbi:MAG: bifunctional riboflavin kinase/FAD synthetase [Candidatus Rokuibacteriota bacterium]|nr:MAG: bifunctional riboflavin kinase/FAD synthetase [Candidatus Rokubacteria bacterium]